MSEEAKRRTKFLRSLKTGDFITIIDGGMWSAGRRMIVCYSGGLVENTYGSEAGWHAAQSIFMLNLANEFKALCTFGADTRSDEVRKSTMAEIFELMDAVRQNGYRYNRTSKILTKINP